MAKAGSPLFRYSPRGIEPERSGTLPYLKTVFSLYRRFRDNHARRFHSFCIRASSNYTANPFDFLADAARHPRARFPSSGCFPRHAVARRGDQLAERSPRRRATQLPSTFPQKANFFRNFAPPFPYTHLRNGNDMPLRSALTQTGTTCTATHVAWPFPLA